MSDLLEGSAQAQEAFEQGRAEGLADGYALGRDEALDRVDAIMADTERRVSPGELRLGEVQELRARFRHLKTLG